MSNSPLVTYTNITANKSKRTHAIDTITTHCYVGQVTAKRGCDGFAKSKSTSANYVVGYDGSIGLSVPEEYRAWATGGKDKSGKPIYVNGISGSMNDHRAVTIEVACDIKYPYAVTTAAYDALVRLVADIAKRNGLYPLKWRADKSLVGKVDQQNMTSHRWFAPKACPGDYLYTRMGDIAQQANKIIEEEIDMTKTEVEKMIQKKVDAALVKDADKVYNTVEELPEWAAPEIQEAIDLGILKGTGTGLGLTPEKLNSVLLSIRAAKVFAGKGGEV